MYICICNAITESQIREAAEAGADDLWDLQAQLGVATNCGSCGDTASAILRENRQAKRPKRRAEPVIYEPSLA
ncbi:MAG: (2Fe-2S)-binding protein [Gammaproteobacteria bacterium]|nr:(2Fe-2S)-binding protein [Gammaproteobacteria bacterium]